MTSLLQTSVADRGPDTGVQGSWLSEVEEAGKTTANVLKLERPPQKLECRVPHGRERSLFENRG